MKSKRGLLGTIILSILLVVVLIGAILFWQIRSNGIQVSSGNFIVELSYNESNPNTEIKTPENLTNQTILNSTNKINITNSSS